MDAFLKEYQTYCQYPSWKFKDCEYGSNMINIFSLT